MPLKPECLEATIEIGAKREPSQGVVVRVSHSIQSLEYILATRLRYLNVQRESVEFSM